VYLASFLLMVHLIVYEVHHHLIRDRVLKLALFNKRCEELLGLRLTQYRPGVVERCISTMIGDMQCDRLDHLLEILAKDKRRRQDFINKLTVNVSSFFRDPNEFSFIKRRVLFPLLRYRPAVRLWSAGCSMGQEAYSLGILLEELDQRRIGRVIGTDIDTEVLAKARQGLYEEKELSGLDIKQRRRFFKEENGKFRVKESLASRITFRKHDLLSDEFPENYYDVIACRNVVIHFDRDADIDLQHRFLKALRSGGVLFLGGAERLHHSIEAELEQVSFCCYMKPTNRWRIRPQKVRNARRNERCRP